MIAYAEDQNLLVSRDISQIERIETMRSDFIANISRELQDAADRRRGLLEMLAEDFEAYSTSEIKHYLALICEQEERAPCNG